MTRVLDGHDCTTCVRAENQLVRVKDEWFSALHMRGKPDQAVSTAIAAINYIPTVYEILAVGCFASAQLLFPSARPLVYTPNNVLCYLIEF